MNKYDKLLFELETNYKIKRRRKIILILIFGFLTIILNNKIAVSISRLILIVNLVSLFLDYLSYYSSKNRIKQARFSHTTDDLYNKYKKIFNEQFRNHQQYTSTLKPKHRVQEYGKLLNVDVDKDNTDTIKKNYRKLAMKWHPDRWSNDTTENQDIAKRNFQRVNNAYNMVKEYRNFN